VNGDFEADGLGFSTYNYMTPSGWQWAGSSPAMAPNFGSIVVSSTDSSWGGGNVPSGTNYLALQGNGAAISQNIVLAPGSTITFYTRNRPWANGTPVTLVVTYGSMPLSQIYLPASISPSLTAWTLQSVVVPAGPPSGSAAQALVISLSADQYSYQFNSCVEIDDIVITRPGGTVVAWLLRMHICRFVKLIIGLIIYLFIYLYLRFDQNHRYPDSF
jgi:hypothetical protein